MVCMLSIAATMHNIWCMCMQILDLTANRITTVAELEPLVGLPSLQRLVLVSNPVAARSATFTKTFSHVSLCHCYGYPSSSFYPVICTQPHRCVPCRPVCILPTHCI